MNATAGWQIDDRSSRHVRSARLCLPPHAPRHRLIATIEESLRLAALPGENEGRVYYFRRLRLSGLPADGDRRVWLDAFQSALSREAAAAIHGNDPRAGMAQAVFFRSLPEALEILLRRIVERRAVGEWFWPMVMGAMVTSDAASSPSGSTASAPTPTVRTIPAIVEALCATPAAWVAVAAAVFAEPRTDFVNLLQAVPVAQAQAWLEEMDGGRPVPVASLEPRISVPARGAVESALRVFGFESPRAVWLTALAILHESPAEMAAGTVVARARLVLRQLASEGYAPRESVLPRPESASSTPPPGQVPLSLPPVSASTAPATATTAPATAVAGPAADAVDAAPPPRPDPSPVSASSVPTERPAPPSAATPESPVGPERLATVSPAASDPDTPAPASVKAPRPVPLPWRAEGFATQAAGLFFLLNVLKRIGIARAFASGLAAARPDFLALIFQRLAAHAGVAEDDPIVVWLASLTAEAPPPTLRNDSALPCKDWWPSNLTLSRDTATVEDLLRAWVLAVRRWCWRTGRITVRETVTRTGVFSVNRTDLDVSLPLDEADIRIRRIGLDLDPGWLPWFGRVVRFHYLYRREFHG